MIPVPMWLALVLVVIGLVAWIVEQPKKARQRKANREKQANLSSQLRAPTASTELPYGYRPPSNNDQG